MPPRRRQPARRRGEIDTRDPFAELTKQFLRQPQIQAAFDRVLDMVDHVGRRVEALPDELVAAAHRPRRVAAPPPPPPAAGPPPPPPPSPAEAARAILHFDPVQTLTRKQVKQRQRELARLVHPDHRGSKEAMQRINAAAATLLVGLP